MKYDFDKILDRKGSNCVKHDLNERVFGRQELLPMWVADMDFEVADFIRSAVEKRAAHPVYGYTFRSSRFFETAADWLKRRHGWEISPEAFSFSPGIVPALNLVVMQFTGPGDRIVVQPPVYFPFFTAVTNHGRTLVHNPLIEKGGSYSIDFDHLEETFREGAKMLLFCHPHNPVGRVWRREELEKLAALCNRYDVLVVSDEIHSDLLLFGHGHVPLASLDPEIARRAITCIAPSKTFNLAGLHTSAVIATDPEIKKGYERILDAVHVGGGNLFGQVAFEAAYSLGDEWVDQLNRYLEKNFQLLKETLSREADRIIVSPLEATYLVWLDLKFMGLDDKELKQFMIREAALGLNDGPMFGPGGEGHQRLNIATPASVLASGLEKLISAIRRNGYLSQSNGS